MNNWEVKNSAAFGTIIQDGSKTVAVIPISSNSINNVALIAAAPDMLEALKEAEQLYSEYGLQANPRFSDRVGPWISATREAIQKAENRG